MSPPSVRPFSDLLRVGAGPVVWFAHFVFMYGAEAIICTPPVASAGTMRAAGGAATVAALAALAGQTIMMLRRHRAGGRAGAEPASAAFLRAAGILLALLATLGVLWTAFPVALLSACQAPAG